MAKTKDITGLIFGRLTVLSFAGRNRFSQSQWLCRCICGNTKIVTAAHLNNGHTRSCGCLKIDLATSRVKTHGLSKTRTYDAWLNMRKRCNDPKNQNYHDYGARGIEVCCSWNTSFISFLDDMNVCPYKMTLERRDNDMGYFKDNCYWATRKTQANNRRSTRLMTYLGETLTMSQWATKLNVKYQTLSHRANLSGWSDERTLSQPVRKVNHDA